MMTSAALTNSCDGCNRCDSDDGTVLFCKGGACWGKQLTGATIDVQKCEGDIAVANCAATTDKDTTKCAQCTQGYFGTGTTCTKNAVVANCMTYDVSADKCAGCNEKFYLSTDGKTCTAQTDVANCSVYSGSAAGECRTCNEKFFRSADRKTCTAVTTEVANCLVHDAADTCSECKEAFFLSTDKKTCTAITAANCASSSEAATCKFSCKAGWERVVASNTCVKAIEGCSTYNDARTECQMCFGIPQAFSIGVTTVWNSGMSKTTFANSQTDYKYYTKCMLSSFLASMIFTIAVSLFSF